MDNIIAKAGRTVTGVACGLIAAELVAIGANAAVDDIVYLVEKVNDVINPNPVKAKGFFRKK